EHFLVMELVQGESLDVFLRERNPALRERLDLFDHICKAINHAHQRFVIHLDIKPSNIMVDADGHPKILDFGHARIGGSESSSTTILTKVGPFRGTLPYMSPERFLGDLNQVDLRADVYSLGVILFELLTGELPFVVSKNAPHETVRRICEETPRRPSRFNDSLRGDMETIILKALEREPARRYQSALAIAEDIDRYLTKRPILARPPNGVYEFRKIVARHRIPFALTVAFLVLTVAFGVWSNWPGTDRQR
ncbi:MAG: serine/threonine protein kinase, partial [Planctomycetes bacterium]|nr:serine/threonine protein kinase [Planctomycetota bacterium]